MAYRIVIEGLTVGILTDQGEIQSSNPFLQQRFARVEVVVPVGDEAGQARVVGPGDKDFIPGVVEELEEAGYGVVPLQT